MRSVKTAGRRTIATDQMLIEILAIKLYEHDHQGRWPVAYTSTSWMALAEEDRQIYRDMVSGKAPMPHGWPK